MIREQYRPALFLILAVLFWAGNYMAGKYVVTELTPLQLTFARWFIAIFFLFPIAQWRERPDWKQVAGEWKKLLAMAILGLIGYNLVLYEALRFTTPLNAALINSINPASIFLFSSLVLHEQISRANIFGLIISLTGVLIVLTNGQLQKVLQIDYNAGDLLMLLAILSWTFYTLIGRKMQGIPPIAATTISTLFGLLLMLPFVLSTGFPVSVSTGALTGVVYIALFPSVGSFLLWNMAVLKVQANQAGIYLHLLPVFTAIFSILLGNTITLFQIVGGLLVFAGVYLTTMKKNR